ncbi:hypothetical protein OROMI_027174 [Orobanche minor]
MRGQKINSKKRKSYASMDVERKAALLHSRRVKYRQPAANIGGVLASNVILPPCSQPGGTQQKSFTQPSMLSKLENIPLHAWSLPFSSPCPLCGAVLYLREPKGFCCLRGQISLPLPKMPQELWNLYTSLESSDAVHFRKRCRTYNNTTAFSSLGITYDETFAKSNKGVYTLRIQGAVYHFIRDLIPAELIVDLMRLNPYAQFFRGLRDLPNLQEYNIVLRADPSLDMGVYSLPTVNQVAAIWHEIVGVPAAQPHDIRVYTSSGQTHRVHYYYGCYDPLQYPLLFPFGEIGWHTGIRRISLASPVAHSRTRKQCISQVIVYPRSHQSAASILDAELQST